MRNPNLPPKPKTNPIDRVAQKRERMDKMMNAVDRVGEIVDCQLQEACEFGDGIHYIISKAVLQVYPHKYERKKGVWKLKGEYMKSTCMQEEPTEITITHITTDWDSNEIPIPTL